MSQLRPVYSQINKYFKRYDYPEPQAERSGHHQQQNKKLFSRKKELYERHWVFLSGNLLQLKWVFLKYSEFLLSVFTGKKIKRMLERRKQLEQFSVIMFSRRSSGSGRELMRASWEQLTMWPRLESSRWLERVNQAFHFPPASGNDVISHTLLAGHDCFCRVLLSPKASPWKGFGKQFLQPVLTWNVDLWLILY